MKVKAEIARRANLNPDGKRRVYSSKYALSGMVFCGHCGDIYRRVKWNNRGCKSTVWRCVSRVLKGQMDFDCPARTVKEEVLQGAIVTAVNDAYSGRDTVISLLKKNIQETVFDDMEARVATVDEQLAELQQQMIDHSGDYALVDELGLQADDLRRTRQDILAEAAGRTDLQSRMNDMIAFLEEMPEAITDYSETLTRRLVDRITIFLLLGMACTGQWNWSYLPLHLCSINVFVCLYNTLTDRSWCKEELYALCIPGAALALLCPSWRDVPGWFTLINLHSVSIHALLVLYPVLLVAGGYRPSVRRVPQVLAFLFGSALPIYFLNKPLHTNFYFLNNPYGNVITSTFTAWFGEKFYILGFLPAIALALVLMYAPWAAAGKKR